MAIPEIECPMCFAKKPQFDLIEHLRFDHKLTIDEMIASVFIALGQLNERITNLCELLEVREK